MNAQTIMICSGKGGTGKSTVSVLLGAQLGAWSRRVLLIELDSGLRSVDMIAGVYGKTVYDIEDVLCGRCDGSKAIVPSPLYPGLSVISAPYEGGEVRAAPLAGLILAMREYFDYILLDTAAGMGAPFTAANRLADRALVVLTPDPVALRDGRIVADALLQSYPGKPHLAARRCRRHRPAAGLPRRHCRARPCGPHFGRAHSADLFLIKTHSHAML